MADRGLAVPRVEAGSMAGERRVPTRSGSPIVGLGMKLEMG